MPEKEDKYRTYLLMAREDSRDGLDDYAAKNLEQAVELSNEQGWEEVSTYYENFNELDNFEEAFSGIWDSEEDFAYETANDIYSEEQLGQLATYIDWEKYARDLFITDYVSEKLSDYKIAVFRRF